MKFLYYFYYRIYHVLIRISDDFMNDMKPGFTIMVLELLILFQAAMWYTMLSGNSVPVPSTKQGAILFAIPTVILMTIANYYVFEYKKKWKKYAMEFHHFPKAKRRAWDSFIIIIILGILGLAVFTCYRASIVFNRPLM